jgi:hypothetical protein
LAQGIGENEQIIGTERLYHDLKFQLIRSSSEDYEPPVISGIDFELIGEGSTANITIYATDPSGIDINQIVILKYADDQVSQILPNESSSDGDAFTINIDNPGNASLIIQMFDNAGNRAMATGKGASMSIITIDVDPDPTVGENTAVALRATLPDFASLAPSVFYSWDFGDGNFATGQTDNGTIEVWHTYPDDNPTGTSSDNYTTKLKVTDSAGGIGNAVTVVTVESLAPVITITGITPQVFENGTVLLSANFTDIGIQDTHTATVDWGDGTVAETLSVIQGNGSGNFSASHTYLDDNPTGTDSDNYTVTITVTDDDTVSGEATTDVLVADVAPEATLEAGETSVIDENDIFTLSGSFTDIGSEDTHTVEIDWGDGTSETGLSVNQESGNFTASHPYLDDAPSGTPSDNYSISVIVRDDDTLTSAVAISTVTVNNVAPVVDAGADQTATEDEPITLSSTIEFSDASTLDTHDVTINWRDGTAPDILVGVESPVTYPSHTFTDNGIYTVTVTVTDDDGGTHSDNLTVTVPEVWTDPEGDVPDSTLIDGDIKGGSMDNDATNVGITLQVSGDISDLYQYRVQLQMSPESTYQVKYNDGNVTGISGASAVVNGSEITFTFLLSDIGANSGDRIYVTAEVQGGVKAGSTMGKLDFMPDSGAFDYLVR